MAVTVSLKLTASVIGISGAGLGGYGIYHFAAPRETIKERIIVSLTDRKKRFLGRGDLEWSNLSSKYTSLQNKPKKLNGISDLSFGEIPEWCERSSSQNYSDSKRELYDQVLRFCFFNTNTLLSNTDSGELKSKQDQNHEEWRVVWDEYHRDTNNKNEHMKITDGTVNTNINGASREQGGSALHTWCIATKDKKMYDSENLFPIFKKWCSK